MGSSGCRAEQARAGDGFQRPLVPRFRFQPRLTRGVRPQIPPERKGDMPR